MMSDNIIETGKLKMDEYKRMDDEVLESIETEKIKFAEESPEPKVEEVGKYVLADNDPYVRGGVH